MTFHRLFSFCAGLLFSTWFGFLFLNGGSRPDENEHCHAAWLVAVQGLKPFKDFFQHHSPLLWDFLALYYYAGGTGVGVMFWGRAGVLVCAGVLLSVLWGLSRREEGPALTFYLAGLTIISSSVMMYEDFTVRPETFSVALFCAGYWFWKKAQVTSANLVPILAAGILAGLAVFASPRTLFLFPLFAASWFDYSARANLRNGALLAMGAITGFVGYALLFGHSLGDYLTFVVWFSAKLQKVGDPFPLRGYYWDRSPFVLMPLFFSFWMVFLFFRGAAPQNRPRQLFWLLTPLLPLVAGVVTSYPHLFPQNLMMGLVYSAIAVVEAGKHFAWPEREAKAAIAIVMLWLTCTTLVDLRKLHFHQQDVLASMAQKQVLLDELAPHEKVLLPYDRHLIAINDASYYAGYLESYSRRQADFVHWAQQYYPLPPFDLLADLKRENPIYICPRSLGTVITAEEKAEFAKLRRKHYAFLYTDDKRWEFSFLAKRTAAVALGNPTP